MNFQEAEAYLLSLGNEVETMKLGLENIRKLLAALGDPQKNYKKVQVAGTNGKGSVCAFLDSICQEAGIRTGLYTSPHLISIIERVKIDGVDISEVEFAKIASLVREMAEKMIADGVLETLPTYFEQVTAIGLVAFAENNVELAILETGLGGRYDAVTAAEAEIAAITRIDLDHQEYLGETIDEIAAEKAAIIRRNSIVCVGRQSAASFDVIKQKCSELGVTPRTLEYARFGANDSGAGFNMDGFQVGEVMLSLGGEHQIENAALAVLVANQLQSLFEISNEQIFFGLERAKHPGRLEYIEIDGRRILLDGAHNLAGMDALVSYLRKYEPDPRILLVFGAMKEKANRLMLEKIVPLATDIILTRPKNSRSAAVDDLYEVVSSLSTDIDVFRVPLVDQAVDAAVQLAATYPATSRSLIVVTGSLYLVGEVKRLLNNQGVAD